VDSTAAVAADSMAAVAADTAAVAADIGDFLVVLVRPIEGSDQVQVAEVVGEQTDVPTPCAPDANLLRGLVVQATIRW
jgi:hypothetical protein